MSIERPVIIPGPGGAPMFAILHEPDRPRSPRTGVNILNPGLRNRMAPNRFNVRLARRLAAAGYWVLCLDPPGIGDSGGEFPEDLAFKVQQTVQMGAFVDAVLIANRTFIRACGLEEIVVSGNCGGAITALLEAPRDPEVTKLMLLDIPVTLRDMAIDDPRPVYDRRHSGRVLSHYARRLTDWRAWWRLASLKSNHGLIARALWVGLRGGRKPGQNGDIAAAPGDLATPSGSGSIAPGESVGALSPIFLEAMQAVHKRGGRVLFINSEHSKTTFLFDTRFAEVYLAPGKPMYGPHEVRTIAGANHTYSTPEWFDAAANTVLEWLDGCVAAARSSAERV